LFPDRPVTEKNYGSPAVDGQDKKENSYNGLEMKEIDEEVQNLTKHRWEE
jgi:hypothetical protein